MFRLISLHRFFVAAAALVPISISSYAADHRVHFGRDVWPIFATRCIVCHGELKHKSDLRLDSPDAVRIGGKMGTVIEPGQPGDSLLLELIKLPEGDDDAMPAKGDRLTAEEIAVIERWIKEGRTFTGWTPELALAANSAIAVSEAESFELPDLALSTAATVEFNREVHPILSDNCFQCHGPHAEARQADLRLDDRNVAINPIDGVRAIVPGDASASALVRRIFQTDPEHRMPPTHSNKSLTENEKLILARWIEQGAEYEEHWAYIAPRSIEPPARNNAGWGRTPIDAFAAHVMTEHGLRPSETANPPTLMRRVSFDLIGLPPAFDEVRAFADDPSDAAYESFVDKLLARPQYGERMAVHWLDLVRYADTNGYHSDESRSVSPYRDYVIDAFNQNMPYDQFTIEQLAGDLLPDATLTQRVAASFNRLNQLTAEGGAQPKEYRAKYAADRVRAVGTVWLGASMGCAECHDHKFDPFTTEDFYSMGAFFSGIEEYEVYSTGETWDPILPLPTEDESERLKALDNAIAELEARIATPTGRLEPGQFAWEEWVRAERDKVSDGWHPQRASFLSTEGGSTLVPWPDYSIQATGFNPNEDIYTMEMDTSLRDIAGLRLELLSDPSQGYGLGRAGTAPIEIAEVEVYVLSPNRKSVQWKIASAADDRNLYAGASSKSTIDGTYSSRWMVKSNKATGDRVSGVYTFDSPIPGGPGTSLRVNIVQHGLNKRVSARRFRISLTTNANPSLSHNEAGVPEDIFDVVLQGNDGRSNRDRKTVALYYREIAPELDALRVERDARIDERLALQNAMLTTLESRESTPHTMRVLPRGDWLDQSGAVVTPNTPKFLPPLKTHHERPTRLDLAQWIVDADNPLTARVFVNRLWKLYFGAGLSRELDDLGSQGHWPTHPELLDWLAIEFQKSGWDVKHMVKLIVTSDLYRQSSRSNSRLREHDPDNLWLARQTPMRLEAETIRDNALAISGLLSFKIGGVSVKPYQPKGYWRNAQTFGGESLAYRPSEGEDQYRRGLYTYWKRSFLHPSLLAFDAPSREECTAERPISNTPLQALVLLNDPTYVEAARVFAARILEHGGTGTADRLDWAFGRALSRSASIDEKEILSQLLDKHVAKYQGDSAAAEALVGVGQYEQNLVANVAELAAWTSVARVVLNLPEVITRF